MQPAHFAMRVRRFDDPQCESMIVPSQGVHLVLPRSFFPGEAAMIVPKTSDGRVIFIIPWHDHAIVGTTDTPIPEATLEPSPQREELQFLLETTAEYLAKPPEIGDVLSVFTGIRPLVKGDKSARTASLSRDHVIRVSKSGLITITGGKWTTVRKMSEDCVDRAIAEAGLAAAECQTQSLKLHGYLEAPLKNEPRGYYGADLQELQKMESESSDLSQPLSASLSVRKSDIIWAVRNEMARTVEDVLARRTRALFLDAAAAQAIAPTVAQLMAAELGKDESWCESQQKEFEAIAVHYTPEPGNN